jgi:hypothetical protein
MGWRTLAESQLGRTPSFGIHLEIFIFGSLHLALLLDILHDHLIGNIPGSRCKVPASPKMLPQNAFFNPLYSSKAL